MVSPNEVKKILEEYDIELTEEELIYMRDWLSNFVDIAIEVMEKKRTDQRNQSKKE